ncbi:hypothetical protein [Runella sp.]|uniref:hypothetical protein n=1 Tax=Runella sp. TaxID=1960881 RepID=UPI003015E253
MEKLFEEKDRNNFKYADCQHNSYEFYDESAINEFILVRERLNTWFDRYPDAGKKQLKRDLQSQFEPAFFELFIHELFYQQGFTLITHPTVPNSTKNPDFLAKKGDFEIYLEATVSFDESNEMRLLKNKQNAVLDALNLINSKRYGINVKQINFLSKKQARLRKIRDYFQKFIDDNGDFYALNLHPSLGRYEREITYQDEDIRVSITLWKVDFDLDKPIISPLGGGYAGGCEEAIKYAIKEKANRYGILDRPYVICINSLSIKQTYTEVVYNALFGSFRNQEFEKRNEKNQYFQTSLDGVFCKNSNQSYNAVTGVFITSIYPSYSNVTEHWLVKHPFTINEMNFNYLDLSYIWIDDNKITEIKKKSIGELLTD